MENVTLIADHVLLPHQADWSKTPQVSRLWRSPVDAALDGSEDRAMARANSWLKLTYSVMIFDQVERARFDVRMRAALKAGKVAVPTWGRGVALSHQAEIGDTVLSLVRADHGITDGKFCLLQGSVPDEFDSWDLVLVLGVNGTELTVASGLANAYAQGTRLWPLLFGKPLPQQFQVLNSSWARHEVQVQFDQRQINVFAYDDFEDYSLGPVTVPLNGGTGWDGPWVLGDIAA